MSIYRTCINGAIWRNIWVVGDLHGCHTQPDERLDAVGSTRCTGSAEFRLATVSTAVRKNVECLELITMPRFMAVRGNHEQMMLDGLSSSGNVNHWLANGGGWFFNLDYDKERPPSRCPIWLLVCHSSSR